MNNRTGNATPPDFRRRIILNLRGGLGNQMFQYACGRSLATTLDLPLVVATDMLAHARTQRAAALERVFPLRMTTASDADLRAMVGALRTRPAVRRLLERPLLAPFRGQRFVVEPHYRWWAGLAAAAARGAYVHGYWHSERYFAAHADLVRRDFAFHGELTGPSRATVQAINSGVAVSVHVRRGDYVSDRKAFAYHGVCGIDYYMAAMGAMRARFPGCRFFVFSDDSGWVIRSFPPADDVTVVVHDGGSGADHQDLWLMSLCRHHIIANSSFSWWGAWLSRPEGRWVIAPQQWYANGPDTRDLVPPEWQRL